MSVHDSVYRRVLRREAHSSKAGLAIVLAVVLALALAYVALEAILMLAGQRPLILAPADLLRGIVSLPLVVVAGAIVAAGIVVALIGFILVISALTPGRRRDHEGPTARIALLIDNRAIASALANTASRAASVDPDQVVVSVGRRTAEIRIQPTAGWPVDTTAVDAAVSAEIDRMQLSPALLARVVIEPRAKVGA